MKRTYELTHDDLVMAAWEWLVKQGHEQSDGKVGVKLVIDVANRWLGGQTIGKVSVEVDRK